ncbi:hypothetical protein HXX76_012438 [Chlamydomonas incerta]|uniref:Sulfhydryl oxidase n=1 Tax=Chlamydomonas incerta TaxID=51695 RepID=A0A835SVU8_CHLIN|nr:hypothetical protein HXX76_012438 [Chlamydomonas incerta]|eukprot:KAG2427505.1 hypothetical protein HXX76_012438 [Chlamydomonas incerta]
MVFEPSHVALQLAVSNFTVLLEKQTATQQCLVEFYASWCPACKHFAPTFEKIAKFLSGQKIGGGKLFIARVDCATEVDLCSQFEIAAYPSLLLGAAPLFAAKQRKSLANFEGPRELAPILTWLGAAFNTTLAYVEPEEEEGAAAGAAGGSGSGSGQASGAAAGTAAVKAAAGGGGGGGKGAAASVKRRPRPSPGAPEWTLADVEGATLMLWQIIGTTPLLHRGAAKREALKLMLAAWACKAGAATLLQGYEAAWPPGAEDAPPSLRKAELCGPPGGLAWRGQWAACAGSQPDSRGFSCGMWFLIHTLAARLPSPAAMLVFLRAFNTHFFACEPCQKHFGRILASPAAEAAMAGRRELVLWLWRTHNEVNERLRGIETQYGHSTTGDPEWPKEAWPAPEACPACWTQKPGSGSGSSTSGSSGSWDEEAVYGYLAAAYGPGSAPGADGVKGSGGAAGGVVWAAEKSSLYSRRVPPPTSSLYGMLPVAGVLAAALMLYIFVRRMRVAAAAGGGGRGGGGGRHVLGPGALRSGSGGGGGHWGGGGHGGGGLWGGGGVK